MHSRIVSILGPGLVAFAVACGDSGGATTTTETGGSSSTDPTATTSPTTNTTTDTTASTDPTTGVTGTSATSGVDTTGPQTSGVDTTGGDTTAADTTAADTGGSSGGSEGSSGGMGGCADLGPAQCMDNPACQPVQGAKINVMKMCLAKPVFLACIDAVGCGDAITIACPAGTTEPWQFQDTCIPPDYEPCEGMPVDMACK